MIRNYEQEHEHESLLNMYVRQYNQTWWHIQQLNDMLDEINNNIHTLTNNQLYRNRNRQFPYRNANHFFNQRQNNYVSYDYNNPINPDIYINTSRNNSIFRNTNTNTNSNSNSNSNSNRNTNINRNNNIINQDDIPELRPRTRPASQTELLSQILSFISPIAVVPTQEQINNASRFIRYGDITFPISEICPITLERFNMNDVVRQIHHCGHIFSNTAFNEWFRSNIRCPVCRYDIRDYNTNNNGRNSSSMSNNDVSNNDVSIVNTNSDIMIDTSNNVSNTDVSNNDVSNNDDNSETTNPISNINIIRDPNSDEIDHITFDLNTNQNTESLLNSLSSRLLQGLLNPTNQNQNQNERFMYDASNNILMFETILRSNI
jgi:hypothetical protein